MGRIDDIVAELRSRDAQPPEPTPAPPTARHSAPHHNPSSATMRKRRRSSDVPAKGAVSKKLLIVLVVLAVLTFIVLPIMDKVAVTASPTVGASVTATATPSRVAVESSTAVPDPGAWVSVIQALDAARATALVHGSASTSAFDDPAGPAAAADTRVLAAIRKQHLSVSSVPLRVESVVERYVTQGQQPRASLTVVDTMDAYDVRTADGVLVRRVPARGPVTWTVLLTRTRAATWRYWSITRVSATSK